MEVVDWKGEFISLFKDLLAGQPKLKSGEQRLGLSLTANAYKDGELVTVPIIGGTRAVKVFQVFADVFDIKADVVETRFTELTAANLLHVETRTYNNGSTNYYCLPESKLPSAGASASTVNRASMLKKIFNRP